MFQVVPYAATKIRSMNNGKAICQGVLGRGRTKKLAKGPQSGKKKSGGEREAKARLRRLDEKNPGGKRMPSKESSGNVFLLFCHAARTHKACTLRLKSSDDVWTNELVWLY